MKHRLKILLLCNRPDMDKNANTICDHIDAFPKYSQNEFFVVSHLGDLPEAFDFQKFDAILIHYSMYLLAENYISFRTKRRIRDFNGLKILFIQDEYRHINAFVDMMNYLKLNILFTCVPDDQIEKVYPLKKLPSVKKINVLTGYVPENLVGISVPKTSERTVDVSYRARKPPFWLGQLAVEKWTIADHFNEYTKDENLRTDISYSESARLYGEAWIQFIANSKTILGVESGASVFDFEGKIQKKVEAFQKKHPEVQFEEVHNRFLKPYEGRIRLNQISPRCFESICLRTVQILFEGEYSGILKPDIHYIPLKKNFSNIKEVVKKIQDDSYLQKMADRAYLDIVESSLYSYNSFIKLFDSVVDSEFSNRGLEASRSDYPHQQFKLDLQAIKATRRRIHPYYEFKHFHHFYGLKAAFRAMLTPYVRRIKSLFVSKT